MTQARPECRCDKCRAACTHIPGLFTPAEAMKAITAGLSHRIMSIGEKQKAFQKVFRALAPMSTPSDGVYHSMAITPHLRLDTEAAKGRCTFLTAEGTCEIHATGFKPHECAATLLCVPRDQRPTSNAEICDAWASPDGRRVVAAWELARAAEEM